MNFTTAHKRTYALKFGYTKLNQAMPLSVGDKFGHYEVLSLLGQGGMGEVYRARDTTLKRDVALKVLPVSFLRDTDHLVRFQREAEVLASLDQPNIGHIYGLADSADSRALVLALVEGRTLGDRIKAGPLPHDEVVAISRQIVDALEYAHDRGVIHRDLKPANIKITPDGVVKVLDFGLAKVLENEPPASSVENSPTLTMGHTRVGMILGTAAYMSPEQAVGRTVDRRSDIFSFGAVLFEMLSGHRAFRGATVPDILEAVVKDEPDWSKLPTDTPETIRRLLRRCLTKDRKQRLQGIGEARIALENPDWVDIPSRSQPGGKLPWVLAGAAMLAAVVLGFLFFRATKSKEEPTLKLSVLPPPNLTLDSDYAPLISPDGTKLAFLARDTTGKIQLWMRPLESLNAEVLAGSEGARTPFWSADGRSINFQNDRYELRRTDLAGRAPEKMCGVSFIGFGGTSNLSGQVLLGSNGNQGLFTAVSGGGRCKQATELDHDRLERGHAFPQFLPDGRHFLYLAISSKRENSGIVVGSLDSKEKKFLLATSSPALYTPSGYLLFLRGQTLVAQHFDEKKLELSGDVVVVAENVATSPYGDAMFSASTNGVLVFRSGTAGTTQLTWFDRAGRPLRAVGPPGEYLNPELSPDGKQVAFQRHSPQGDFDIWQMSVEHGTPQRFTFSPADEVNPIWSPPDGSIIAFGSNQEATAGVFRKRANGAGSEEQLLPGNDLAPMNWSSDGQFIVFRLKNAKGMNEGWFLPTLGNRKAFGYLQSGEYSQNQPRLSPNGHWLAYYAASTGQSEIYLEPFPKPGGKWQISMTGGMNHRWSHDGKELYYMAPNSDLMAVAVKGETAPGIGTPEVLFKMRVLGGARTLQGFRSQYDVAPDGRFLVSVPLDEAAGSSITVVLNWPATLK